MFQVSTSNQITISEDFIKIALIIIAFVIVYFFSSNILRALSSLGKKLGGKIGVWSVDQEYKLVRYTYQHSSSPITKYYNWVNMQLIAIGLKKQGVTVSGYTLFFAFISLIFGAALTIILRLGVLGIVMYLILFIGSLILTRVLVSERMERREADVMNAIDLIIPEIANGVKNSIVMYQDNFAPSLQEDFKTFVGNIQDRGYTFEDAMYLLTDNLGTVFRDFAQKAIYYEAVGEKEMQDIFTDITETNRLRRQLRDENQAAFTGLTASFLISSLITFGYFVFLLITDEFSRTFFLTQTGGKFLLLVMICVVFAVLAYITTIKSRAI